MRQIVFAAQDPTIVEEIKAVLPGIEAKAVAAQPEIGLTVIESAKRAAINISRRERLPAIVVFTELNFSALSCDSYSVYLRELDLNGPEVFCLTYGGMPGVARIVSAFSLDGDHSEIEQREIPGRVAHYPAGTSGTALDKVWIPNGYQRSVSQLMDYQPSLNRRERAYRMAGSLLGITAADGFYEAHITVDIADQSAYRHFWSVCSDLGVKAIHIELASGLTPTHLITGSVHRGELPSVVTEVNNLEQMLKASGLHPTRLKIEAMVQNPVVPLTDQEASGRPQSNYFEFHTKVTLAEGDDMTVLNAVCRSFGAHLARSASNRLSDGCTQRFVTVRFHDEGRFTAEARFSRLLSTLKTAGFGTSHVLKEYVVIDTNLGLDAGWADSAIPATCYRDCSLLAVHACPFEDSAATGNGPRLINLSPTIPENYAA